MLVRIKKKSKTSGKSTHNKYNIYSINNQIKAYDEKKVLLLNNLLSNHEPVEV